MDWLFWRKIGTVNVTNLEYKYNFFESNYNIEFIDFCSNRRLILNNVLSPIMTGLVDIYQHKLFSCYRMEKNVRHQKQ